MTIPVARELDHFPLTSEEDVYWHTIADGQWRILDRRLPDHDLRALLGFVQNRAGVFEVSFMNQPLHTSYYADIAAVSTGFVSNSLDAPGGAPAPRSDTFPSERS